ncbi:N-6 DNA methylase [Micromonospora sp. WMMD736]|uniref:class I SAM-dependent DNA methyltransferase n=1 Tax=Micromonospora sp. WMMD736 TaxID=3404112 RepID=UPI003B92A659
MADLVARLWSFCHVLRHDGIDYGDYIEELTYLLFLKMADERDVNLPAGSAWPDLIAAEDEDLLPQYRSALQRLGEEGGILGEIFRSARTGLGNSENLRKLLQLIDEMQWTALNVDVKAAAFEGLLEKAAAEGKRGAGQYFTPRPLIKVMVRLMKPDPREAEDFKVMDPACGTGGFLVAAYEWFASQVGGTLPSHIARRVRERTYFGTELVQRPRRLALMNMFLHQVQPHIELKDAIYGAVGPRKYTVVLTNPPFGNKGIAGSPTRSDFSVATSSKQLNFLQHVLTILEPDGRAAVVIPDNVLFADQAGEVFRSLMEAADVHTLLRCPRGTFNPYTDGTNTNVLFFTKGRSTKDVWIYDARSDVPKINKTSRPLTEDLFREFEACYGDDPNGTSKRSSKASKQGRWRPFSIDEVRQNDFKLDSFKWMGEQVLGETEGRRPDEFIEEAIVQLQASMQNLAEIDRLLTEFEAAT